MARETDYTVAEKACTRCEQVKSAADFYFSKTTKTKLSARCKACVKQAAKESVERRKDEVREYKRAWGKQQVESGRRRSQWHENRERHAEVKRAYLEGNPEKITQWNRARLLRKYSLTAEAYEEMLHSQGGCCMICNQPPEEGTHLAIDHDHACCPSTGSCGECVRGLLCMKCNTMLGKAGDDIEVLLKAVDYLRKWNNG